MDQGTAQAGFELSREQVSTFAAGLYQLASCDGIDDSELALIREFVEEAGEADLSGQLENLHFDPATAYGILESSWLRKLFLKAALLLVRADGVVSEAERENLQWLSMAFGVPGGYDALVADVEGDAL